MPEWVRLPLSPPFKGEYMSSGTFAATEEAAPISSGSKYIKWKVEYFIKDHGILAGRHQTETVTAKTMLDAELYVREKHAPKKPKDGELIVSKIEESRY